MLIILKSSIKELAKIKNQDNLLEFSLTFWSISDNIEDIVWCRYLYYIVQFE